MCFIRSTHKYFGTSQKYLHEELRCRLNSGDVSYHSVQNIFSLRLLTSKRLKMYETIILPVSFLGGGGGVKLGVLKK
jgi:hypothetical protein